MLKTHWKKFQSLLLVLEILLSAAIFAVLAFDPVSPVGATPGFGPGNPAFFVLGIVAGLTWPLVLRPLGLYSSQRRSSLFAILPRLLAAGVASTVMVAAAAFLLSAPVAPAFALVFGASQFVGLSLLRLAVLGTLRWARRSGRNYRNILIVGSGPRARDARQLIGEHPAWALRIVGFVDDYEFGGAGPDALGPIRKFADLPALFRDHVIDEVVVALPRSMLTTLGPVVELCALVGVPLTIPSDIFGDYLPAPHVTRFGGAPALSFAPVHHSRLELAGKRLIDVVGASAALVALAPVMAVAAALIRATSPGPVIFRQRRCGLHGRQFSMYKLRTMVVDAEARKQELADLNECDGPVFKMRQDPRVTPVGRFLRRWSLDELPQFWNVLLGDMSLVGPRPPVPAEVALYRTSERRRLSMRPGITCIWQVNGRSEVGFVDWVKLDVEYIENWSFALDFQILLKTIPAVLGRTGAS